MAVEIVLTDRKIRQFWSLVDVGGPNDCWLWQGNLASNGYGRFRLGHRKIGAHRIALVASGQPQPPAPNNHALHGDCSNRVCCNPAHLRWGSNSENIADMMRLDRHAAGSEYASARLSEVAVAAIRASHDKGCELAARYGVSKALISLVRNRKIWRHVA